MPCDDLTALPDAAPGNAPATPLAGATATPARRQPGSALRQLEKAVMGELQHLLAARGRAAHHASIADPVWAGLAWDMGLNGTAIDTAGTAAPLPGYLALDDRD
ncbi:hypothetical protein [Xanthomonas sp.]|uniref:hypothetical protein n=1 Tax=Xanthomonas sp. TaxID=29446 RepID=UPI001F147655|nr:hypothetical protein [Xanthomonas sp.]